MDILSSIDIIYKEGGLKSFFRGTMARVMILCPSSGIGWASYEFLKNKLFKYNKNFWFFNIMF